MKKTPKNPKPARKRTAHIVSHTHWDREWRYPIWETRLMLIDFMNELIEVLETGKYPGFLLDGQVSPVLDYLEVRPEMAARVRRLVKAGKLQIGPWLTLPDEYPVDGEAMVRNLLLGNRKCRELGGVFNVGYTPFGWGQTAQLPQLYAGFGMDVAMIGKRVNKERAPKCEFLWRGPDGTQLLSTRFGDIGRQNFYFTMHLSALFGVEHLGDEWVYDWANGGVAFHRADREQMEQDHFRVDAPTRWYPGTVTREMADRAWSTCGESVMSDDRLMMNGCDYTAAQPMFPEMVRKLNEIDADTDRVWVHETMPQYVALMRKKLAGVKLPVVHGELRDGPACANTGNALTTRLYVKRLNKLAQNMLIRFAEPLGVLAGLAGAEYQKSLFARAWDFLLSSHPHDSINSVTQDKTSLDVENRLHQVVDLSQSLGNRAMQELVRRIDTSSFAAGDVLITVFNPLPYPRRDVIEVWVNLPNPTGPSRHLHPNCGSLQVEDASGKPVGTQWMGTENIVYAVAELHTRAFPFDCMRHRLYFDTAEVPAGGYKIFRVKTTHEGSPKGAEWSDGGAFTSNLLKSPHMMENEFLRVEMNPNGTFDLTDRKSGVTHAGLNYYQDRGEHGDYWNNKRPMCDQVHTSLGCVARIWAEEAGPMQARLVSEVTMRLPSRGIREQQRRGDELVDFVIRTAVVLRAGTKSVEVNVEFENRHEDHYLRVMFPTGIKRATAADAGGHFVVDRRSARPQGPSPETYWPDMATLPQNNFVDVSDGKRGLAFLNDSLTEYELLDNDERTVALSLLRSVKDWLCTEHRAGSDFPSQKGGQSFGRHSIRFAVMPHEGDWTKANVPLAAELFNVPVRPVQTRANKGKLPAGNASLFSISNLHLRFSAIKPAEDRDTTIVRVYNPTAKTQSGTIRLSAPARNAWLTNLNEDREKAITPDKSGAVTIQVAPCKIVTVEIKTGG